MCRNFFYPVCCKIPCREYYINDYIFVRPTISTEHIDSDPPTYRSYYHCAAACVTPSSRYYPILAGYLV